MEKYTDQPLIYYFLLKHAGTYGKILNMLACEKGRTRIILMVGSGAQNLTERVRT